MYYIMQSQSVACLLFLFFLLLLFPIFYALVATEFVMPVVIHFSIYSFSRLFAHRFFSISLFHFESFQHCCVSDPSFVILSSSSSSCIYEQCAEAFSSLLLATGFSISFCSSAMVHHLNLFQCRQIHTSVAGVCLRSSSFSRKYDTKYK